MGVLVQVLYWYLTGVAMQYPIDGLAPILSTLTTRDILKRARSGVLVGSWAQLKVSPGEALLLWLAEALQVRMPVSSEQQTLLLSHFWPKIIEIPDAVGDSGGPPVFQLIIADGTMACLTGMADYLDLRTGDTRPSLPRMAMELVSYNLSAIFIYHTEKHAKKGDNNA